jgi:hypothetical protein
MPVLTETASIFFAWGGSDMLIDETTSFAGLNDRIEIEIRGNR